MRLTFISKSDLRGGAAIVTYRLVEALRAEGVDARMLVTEKLSDSDFVALAASSFRIKTAFLFERLEVFCRNGFNRKNLFKVDPASCGLPLWRHPWVSDSDAVFLGWVNQAMLSLEGIRRLSGLGKPLVWIMHDMWNMTGICHHAASCRGFLAGCGSCPLLGSMAGRGDMSEKVWRRKSRLYGSTDISFVAVSSWLARRAADSSLLRSQDVTVIPNPFCLPAAVGAEVIPDESPVGVVFGAARLDDPVKGLPVLKQALSVLKDKYPEVASNLRLVTFGSVKDSESLRDFPVAHTHLGVLGADALGDAYRNCRIVVSASDFETLPGTLVEGQAYGCIPVAFDHGGQRDIIDHLSTGWLAQWDDDPSKRAESIADGIAWAYERRNDSVMFERMRQSVSDRFGASSVARAIVGLVRDKLKKP